MRHSNLIISAAVAISTIFGIGAASAADLPARSYTKAPAMVDPGYNWSGFYIGINGGFANDGGNTRFVDWTLSGFDPGPAFGRSSSTNGLVGLHGGYNWQVSPNWLLGLEVDGDWTSLGSTNAGPLNFLGVPFGTANTSVSDRIRGLESVRGRVGYIAGSILLYGTGGVAWTSQNLSGFLQTTGGTPAAPYSVSATKTGWVAGAGIEGMLAPHWLLRLEYLHYGFSSGGTVAVNCAAIACPGTGFVTYGKTDIDTVRAGVSYLFGGPVVAKY
jgi:outer membrane immunogenic protein